MIARNPVVGYFNNLELQMRNLDKAHLVSLLPPRPVPHGDVVLNVVHHTKQVTPVSLGSRKLDMYEHYLFKKTKMNYLEDMTYLAE